MSFAETIQIALQNIPTYSGDSGNGTVSGNGVLKIENYVDQILQYPLAICKSVIWWDGETAIPPSVFGNLAFAVDPRGEYCRKAGWPLTQKWEPILLNPLGVYEIFPGGKRRFMEEHTVPVRYDDGDIIIQAPELAGGISRAWLALAIISDTRIMDWPSAAEAYNIALDTNSSANPGYCLRNLIPGSPAGATQVRAHVSSLYTATLDCKLTHLSIGVQDGSTPSTVSDPVPLTFAGLRSYSMYPDIGLWTDWVDCPIVAGQNWLVTAGMFNPGSTNSWSFSMAGGAGCWSSTTDYTFAKDMPDAHWQPGRSHVFDRVQYR